MQAKHAQALVRKHSGGQYAVQAAGEERDAVINVFHSLLSYTGAWI